MNARTTKGPEVCATSGRRSWAPRKPGREIAFLAGLQILFFSTLMLLETRFLLIHLYEVIPYVAILLLFAYGQPRWVYLVGTMVSVMWLTLAYTAGLLDAAVERIRQFHSSPTAATLVAVLALATAGVAVLIIVLCRAHWRREFSRRGWALPVLLGSIAIVAAYYAALLHWFWDMMPGAFL